MSDTQPITNGSGQTFTWNMCVPEGAIINTANSCLSYKMKFTFNCKQTTDGVDGAGAVPSVPSLDPNAPA